MNWPDLPATQNQRTRNTTTIICFFVGWSKKILLFKCAKHSGNVKEESVGQQPDALCIRGCLRKKGEITPERVKILSSFPCSAKVSSAYAVSSGPEQLSELIHR